MKLKSLEELYNKAVKDIKNEKGVITITIGGIPKISKSNDIIGNCVQEWIPQWLEDNGLVLESNENSQCFPDFTAEINGVKYDMEVKCWNYTNAPAFDIANFDGFYREIYTHPKKLHAKYLIFGYIPITHGFKIENIYLKNIWEITSKSQIYPIGLQVKQGRPYAIRPFAFHKKPDESFADINEFVKAIYETRKMFALDDMIDPDEWYKKVTETIG
ncbi:MAG: NgoBV family restriction endonuclease [Oscillospiraceae bacterium]|nr:NgoBV family restriction endonuclease [Oscillospiraceae bacterium]